MRETVGGLGGAGKTLARQIADLTELKNETPFKAMLAKLVELGCIREGSSAAWRRRSDRGYRAAIGLKVAVSPSERPGR